MSTTRTRTREYNIVIEKSEACIPYELLTDHELEVISKRYCDHPRTRKVRVRAGTTYFFFGARFAEEAETERIINELKKQTERNEKGI